MRTFELILIAFTIANAYWSWANWRNTVSHKNEVLANISEISDLRQKAVSLFRAAEQTLQDQAFKVCSGCPRIVARYITTEGGKILCSNCAKKLEKEAAAAVTHG